MKLRGIAAVVMLCAAMAAQAHVASNSFLSLHVTGGVVDGSLELAVRDAEIAVGLDADHDGKVTWGEVRAAQGALVLYLRQHLQLSQAEGYCELRFGAVQINERIDGNYLWQPFTAVCPAAPRALTIDYRLLDQEDPSHRGLLTLTAQGVAQTAVLGGSRSLQSFDLRHPSMWHAFVEYLQAGIWHIWSGIDHLLFLLSLLLPAVLLRRGRRWHAVPQAAPALLNIIKVVTAFTLAHSITLSLAAFDIIRLPSRLTESVIAGSIVVAALNNVFPLVTEARWRIAFAFGLLHGFGFAAVLAEMGLPQGARLVSLVAFNLGVEAGQLAVVLAVMPVAYLLRSTRFYQGALLPWGSTGIAGLALVWLIQRATG
ncbi:MAG: HupE/UreJ family protein [Steroidobacteraceae bacterium]